MSLQRGDWVYTRDYSYTNSQLRGTVVEYDIASPPSRKWVCVRWENGLKYSIPEEKLQLFDHPRLCELYVQIEDGRLIYIDTHVIGINAVQHIRSEAVYLMGWYAKYNVHNRYWIAHQFGTCIHWELVQ